MALSTKLRFWIRKMLASTYYGDQFSDAIDAKLESASLAASTLATPITGYVSGAGAIGASTTVLGAINRLNGNTALKEATLSLPASTLATPLTGFVSGPGAVLATDTVLEAVQKLDGNVGLKQGTITMNVANTSAGGELTIGGMTATGKVIVVPAEDPGAGLAMSYVVAGAGKVEVHCRHSGTNADTLLASKAVAYFVISLS